MSNSTNVSARQRIDSLLDDSSFVEVGAYVTSRSTDFNIQNKETPADGVITGYGLIDGCLVYVYSQDSSVIGGAIGEMHAKKIARIYDMAIKMGAPVIGLIDCAGLRLQEATDALNGFGELFFKQTMASGVVPQITAVFGVCGGGTALIPALSDFTYMTKDNAKLFVNSPNALAGNYEEKCDTSSAEFNSEKTGLVDDAFDTEEEVLGQIRQLVVTLEDEAECNDDLNRIVSEAAGYAKDAKSLLISISDNNFFLETKKDFGKCVVTGFIRLNGATVGCIANEAEESDGAICANGAEKAAKMVEFCDAFDYPILTITNVNGFKATKCSEKRIAKAAAKLTYAFANATVPKVNVMVGDAFGTAYTMMNSKAIGADVVYAWPTAKIGMMNAKSAVEIMYADEIAKESDKQAFINEKVKEYEDKQSSPMAAAKHGYVDDIIEPDATRKRVIAAFEMLYTKIEDRPAKKHGTV